MLCVSQKSLSSLRLLNLGMFAILLPSPLIHSPLLWSHQGGRNDSCRPSLVLNHGNDVRSDIGPAEDEVPVPSGDANVGAPLQDRPLDFIRREPMLPFNLVSYSRLPFDMSYTHC